MGERAGRPLDQRDLFAELLRLAPQKPVELRVIQIRDRDPPLFPAVLPRREQVKRPGVEVVDPLEILSHPDGPGERRALDLELVLDVGEDLHRLHPVPVELVDEGHDRGVAHPADLHELLRLRLDPLPAVDDHQRTVHGRENPVGVLGEVLVARGVQQVDFEIPVVELHHGGGDGDPPLLFDRHPVARGVASGLAGLHRAGKLDRAAEEEKLLGQRRFPGVRVADDAEGPPLLDFLPSVTVNPENLLLFRIIRHCGRDCLNIHIFLYPSNNRFADTTVRFRGRHHCMKKSPTAFGLRGQIPSQTRDVPYPLRTNMSRKIVGKRMVFVESLNISR